MDPCGDQCRNSLRHQCPTREPDNGVVGDGHGACACRLRKLQAALNVLSVDKLVEHSVVHTRELRAPRDIAKASAATTDDTSKEGWWSTDGPATSAKLDVKSDITARWLLPQSVERKPVAARVCTMSRAIVSESPRPPFSAFLWLPSFGLLSILEQLVHPLLQRRLFPFVGTERRVFGLSHHLPPVLLLELVTRLLPSCLGGVAAMPRLLGLAWLPVVELRGTLLRG